MIRIQSTIEPDNPFMNLYNTYVWHTPLDNLPTLLQLKIAKRKGIPKISVSGHIVPSDTPTLMFLEELFKSQGTLKYRRVAINIFNPLNFRVRVSDLIGTLQKIVLNLLQNQTLHNIYPTSLAPHFQALHASFYTDLPLNNVATTRPLLLLTTRMVPNALRMLFDPSKHHSLPTNITSSIRSLQTKPAIPNIIFPKRNNTIQFFPPSFIWIKDIRKISPALINFPRQSFTWVMKTNATLPIPLELLHILPKWIIISPTCNCGARFTSSCSCSKTSLQRFLAHTLLPLIENFPNLIILLDNNKLVTSIPASKITAFYV